MRASDALNMIRISDLTASGALRFLDRHRDDYARAGGLAAYHGFRLRMVDGSRDKDRHHRLHLKFMERASAWEALIWTAIGNVERTAGLKTAQEAARPVARACADSFERATIRARERDVTPCRYVMALAASAGRN